ncbi:hypothetical protein RN001_013956 [Aquatica leii]|uniref:DUF4806 domain-containing protein n=1 Tax=Aquatica leii TaxID=1421715 RepID=A0AAN7P558_9COLE|nr:hypothetical protein RN001_013956 [Aquatica leii]
MSVKRSVNQCNLNLSYINISQPNVNASGFIRVPIVLYVFIQRLPVAMRSSQSQLNSSGYSSSGREPCNEQEYAVVAFDNCEVEAVPLSWLNKSRNMCWWPVKSKNVRNLIKYSALPNEESWKQHDVDIIKIYGTYAEAQKKATHIVDDINSSQEESIGGECRKPKTEYFEDDIQTYEIIPMEFSEPEDATIHFYNGDIDESSNQIKDTRTETTSQPKIDSSRKVDLIVECDDKQHEIIDCHKMIETGFGLIMDELSKINVIVQQNNSRLERLEASMRLLTDTLPPSSNTGLPFIIPKLDLPLSTIEKLNELEAKLADKEFRQHFVDNMKLLRGGKPDEFIRQMWANCVTNEVAALCSWSGIRESFEIKSLKLVELIEDVVRMYHSDVTKKMIKDVSALWFRNSNQRIKRQKEKENKITNVY